MGFFGSKDKAPNGPTEAERLEEQIAGLRDELQRAQAETTIGVELEEKKQELLDLELKIDKIKEDHKREIREVEHKVGLQQQKAEQDQAAAVREAELKVREANLETEKNQFQSQMDFQRTEMEKRADAQERLLNSILERLPKHSVNETIIRGNADGETQRAAITAGGSSD